MRAFLSNKEYWSQNILKHSNQPSEAVITRHLLWDILWDTLYYLWKQRAHVIETEKNCVFFCWKSLNYNFEMNFIHRLNVWHLVLIYELKFQAHNKVSVLLGTLLNSSTSSWNSFEIFMKYFIWVIQDLQANTKASFTGNIRCFIIEDKMQNHYLQNFGHQFSFRWEPEPILGRDIFHYLAGPCDSTKTLKYIFKREKYSSTSTNWADAWVEDKQKSNGAHCRANFLSGFRPK